MKSIKDIQEEIISEFELFDEWEDKYAYIIELGKKLPALDDQYKTEAYKIKGCQSQVWMNSTLKDGLVYYEGESDAMIVKGLVSLLIKVLSGHSPQEIIKEDLYFIDKIGMQQHLSMTRSNGLASMVKQMKLHALAYQTKTESN